MFVVSDVGGDAACIVGGVVVDVDDGDCCCGYVVVVVADDVFGVAVVVGYAVLRSVVIVVNVCVLSMLSLFLFGRWC